MAIIRLCNTTVICYKIVKKQFKNNCKFLKYKEEAMKNSTKQVVILDNFTSPYIHQAILILKDYNPAMEHKIIAEAERIVASYFQTPQEDAPPPKKPVLPWLISGISIVCSIALYISSLAH